MPRKKSTNTEAYNKDFPRRLREIMREKGETQQTVGDAIGKTRQAVGYYADGSSSPDWETIVKIAKHFGVSTDYLLGLTDQQTLNAEIRAICDYTGLSEEAVDTLSGWKSKHPWVEVCNYLLEKRWLIRYIVNYFSDFALEGLSKPPYKYIPIKPGHLYLYRNDVHFSATIRVLQESRKKFEDKYKDDEEFVNIAIREFLLNHADIQECKKIVDEDIPDFEADAEWFEEYYGTPRYYEDMAELDFGEPNYEAIEETQIESEKEAVAIRDFLSFVAERNK